MCMRDDYHAYISHMSGIMKRHFFPSVRLAMEMDEERKARLEKMLATAQLMLALIKGVVNVGVVLSLKPILKQTMLIIQT